MTAIRNHLIECIKNLNPITRFFITIPCSSLPLTLMICKSTNGVIVVNILQELSNE